jgi:hypothetical protein
MKSSFSFTIPFLMIMIFVPGVIAQKPTSTTIAGKPRGDQFSDMEIPSKGRVSEVYVYSEKYICAVQMQFTLSDGRTRTSLLRGGSCGKENIFHLDLDEYIIGLSGRYDDDHINSIQIHTNKRTSPLFAGSEGSWDYTLEVASGNQAVGFVGRSGRYLNAIGLNFIPLSTLMAGQTMIFGGKGGAAFSDEDVPRGARISEVRVISGDKVNSIQAIYTLLNGDLVEGAVHGDGDGSLNVFRLDPEEYVVGFSGRCSDRIHSLSIRTNKRTSQVFGRSGEGNIFTINVPSGNYAIGFRGRSSSYLDAVGLNYASIARKRRP